MKRLISSGSARRLDVGAASATATHVLSERYPDKKFRLINLQATNAERESWTFRCKAKGEQNTLICKVGTPDMEGADRLSEELKWLEELWQELRDSKNTVPRPIYFSKTDSALLMEDAKGDTVGALLQSASSKIQIEKTLSRAGNWLAEFHSRSSVEKGFNVKPHSNWLNKSLKEHQVGQRQIGDYNEFSEFFALFSGYEKLASQTPARHCVTHRDFNTGNLVLRGNGKAFGIDFYNRREDIWVRDAFRFIEDASIQIWHSGTKVVNFSDLWSSFLRGYGASEYCGRVTDYFGLFYALNSWANVGTRRRPTKYDLGRLRFAKHLARSIVGN